MMHFDKVAKCSASEREVSIGVSASAEACLSAVKALGAMTNLAIWRGDFDEPECFACDKTGSPSSYPGAFEDKKKAVTMYDKVARTPTPTASPTTTPTRMPTTSSPTAVPTKAPTTQLTPAPTPANGASANGASANGASTATTRKVSDSWPKQREIEADMDAGIMKVANDAFALAKAQGATEDLAATAAGEAAGKAVLQKPQNSYSSAAGASSLGEAAGNNYFLAAAVSAMITKMKGGSITAQQTVAGEITKVGGGSEIEAAAAANDVAAAAASVGTVPIQAGTTPKMGYYKFKVTPLRPGERLTGSTLSLKKLEGPGSVCTVKLTSCTYDSTALSRANKPQVLEEVTKSGSLFPVANGQVTLDLKSDIVKGALERVRVADPKICVEVSGGVPLQQVLIQDVHLNLMVNRSDAALPDDKIPTPV